MTRPRVVVAGLGDSGLLTAIHLSRHADVVGISAKPGLVSGQELGMRLTRPDEWSREYWRSFDRYRRLDRVRTVHGTLTGLDLERREVAVTLADGGSAIESYDVLQAPDRPDVFAIGDVAATDPLRSSARNRADRLLARNIRAHLAGRSLRSFKPSRSRWGSVVGPQPDGLQIFAPTGQPFRVPAWSVRRVLFPWIVRRGIYKGVRTR